MVSIRLQFFSFCNPIYDKKYSPSKALQRGGLHTAVACR